MISVGSLAKLLVPGRTSSACLAVVVVLLILAAAGGGAYNDWTIAEFLSI